MLMAATIEPTCPTSQSATTAQLAQTTAIRNVKITSKGARKKQTPAANPNAPASAISQSMATVLYGAFSRPRPDLLQY
jgi:hypothetical protein